MYQTHSLAGPGIDGIMDPIRTPPSRGGSLPKIGVLTVLFSRRPLWQALDLMSEAGSVVIGGDCSKDVVPTGMPGETRWGLRAKGEHRPHLRN
jgi:hypothetical protein